MSNMMSMTCMARADFGGPVLMSATDVYTYLGISKSYFYNHVRNQPTFPKPVGFFTADRWRKREIDDWVNSLPYQLGSKETDLLDVDLRGTRQ